MTQKQEIRTLNRDEVADDNEFADKKKEKA